MWWRSSHYFKVCHEDETEWTEEEIRQYVLDNHLPLDHCALETFRVNPYGDLLLSDYYDNHVNLYPPEFNVAWVRKEISSILENESRNGGLERI